MAKNIKVLNLYCGIGGNRKLWENVEVTAIENNDDIAKVYKHYFPKDKVIITDAHEYLLKYYKEFDFIWSSPPCPTHSDIRRCGVDSQKYPAKYPDMKLYEEIIFLKHFSAKNTKWVVENVISYYEPLIKPFEVQRHYFWSNFIISQKKDNSDRIHSDIIGSNSVYAFDISKTNIKEKRKVLRNLVNPNLALHIFKSAFRQEQKKLINLI